MGPWRRPGDPRVAAAIADAGFGAAALLGLRSELAKAKEALNLRSDAVDS